MRVIKGIILFCFSMVAVSACFDPPEFSNSPKIFFKDIKFKEVGDAGELDSLIVTLDFEDGDGDIGLSSDPADSEFPYNSEFYYLQDGSGDTIPIISQFVDVDSGIYAILNDGEIFGKIVTNKTRTLPEYGFLPVYDRGNCYNYKEVATVMKGNPFPGVLTPLSSVDETYQIEDTITLNGKQYARITDPLFYRRNLNYYNIEVKFWQFQDGGFVEYDWFNSDECNDFFGRFTTSNSPFPTYKNQPIEGTLRYGMVSSAFIAIFGNNKLKISVRIRDRALHTSNIIFSQEFDLNQIR